MASPLISVYILPPEVFTGFNGYASNGQPALLQEVKNEILKTYSQTDVGADGQVVVVDFEALKIEVFPALIHCFPAKTQCGRERPQPSVKLGHHRNCI